VVESTHTFFEGLYLGIWEKPKVKNSDHLATPRKMSCEHIPLTTAIAFVGEFAHRCRLLLWVRLSFCENKPKALVFND
jgi:hypothetical protein